MKDIIFYFVFISAIVALFAFAFSFSQNDEPAGKTIFLDSKCGKCHSVESLNLVSSGKKLVDLSNTGNKLNAEFLTKYLKKEDKLNDKNHSVNFKGEDVQLNSLVEWLLTLKKEQ